MSSFIYYCPGCGQPFMTDNPDDICDDCKSKLPGTYEPIQAERHNMDADPDACERATMYTQDELLNIKAGDSEPVLGPYDLTSGAAYLFAKELVTDWTRSLSAGEDLEQLLGDVPLGIQQILDWWDRIRQTYGIKGGYGNNTRLAGIIREAEKHEEEARNRFCLDNPTAEDWEQYDHCASYAEGLRRALAILEGRTNP